MAHTFHFLTFRQEVLVSGGPDILLTASFEDDVHGRCPTSCDLWRWCRDKLLKRKVWSSAWLGYLELPILAWRVEQASQRWARVTLLHGKSSRE